MDSLLKQAFVSVSGVSFEIRELSAKAMSFVHEASREGKHLESSSLVLKYGVLKWADETIEDIASNTPIMLHNELVTAIMQLSGLGEEKKSPEKPQRETVHIPAGNAARLGPAESGGASGLVAS